MKKLTAILLIVFFFVSCKSGGERVSEENKKDSGTTSANVGVSISSEGAVSDSTIESNGGVSNASDSMVSPGIVWLKRKRHTVTMPPDGDSATTGNFNTSFVDDYPPRSTADTSFKTGWIALGGNTIDVYTSINLFCDSIDWKYKYDSLFKVLEKCRRTTYINKANEVHIGPSNN